MKSELFETSKVNSEFVEWITDGMDHFVVPPDADIHDLFAGVWDEMDFDLLVDRHLRYFDSVVEQRDTAIAVDHSGFAQAEDIFG